MYHTNKTDLDLQFNDLQEYYNQVIEQAEQINDPARQALLYELSKHLKNAISIINRQSCYISSIMTIRSVDAVRQELEQENNRLKQLLNEHGIPLQSRFTKGTYKFY